MSVTVDASVLARGWLSVAVASVKSGSPQLDRTVCIEQHTHGLRLVATDSYILLTTWIPAVGHDLEPEPDLDKVPYATVVAFDEYGRGAGLLRHLLALAKADEDKHEIDLDVTVRLNVPWQDADTPTDDLQLDGLAALAVTIDHPDRERVQLPVYEGNYPGWQRILGSHTMKRPMALAMAGDVLVRLGKAAKLHNGAVVYQRFGGLNKPVHVTFGDRPAVTGLAMPCRWDLDKNEPVLPDSDDEEDT